MSDLVIREKDGWDELEDFHSAISKGDRTSSDLREVWNAGASGDMGEVSNILDGLGYDIEDEVVGFRIIAEPDDIQGDYYRAWIKTK